MHASHTNHDLRNLLFVIFASIIAAFGLTFFFIYNYGPTGLYRVSSVLLDPSVLEQLNYNDTDPKTGGTSRYSYDGIEFTWYDFQTKELKKLQVDKEKYSQIYTRLFNDSSIKDVTDDVRNQFNQPHTAHLVLTVKTESSAKWQANAKVFQETEFMEDGDFFRIELHEQNKGEHWAYFHRPHVFNEVLSILVPKQ